MSKDDVLKLHDIRFNLELKITESNDLSGLVEIQAYPLTDDWNEGNGRGMDTDPIYDPVNYVYKRKMKSGTKAIFPALHITHRCEIVTE